MKTPKSMRLHIAILGRSNVGKSSLLNIFSGQDVAITSPIAGTTTDVVEKVMELLPVGPVVFLDTAGLDDKTELGNERIERTKKTINRADLILLIVEADIFTDYEQAIIDDAKARNIPVITVINKSDIQQASDEFKDKINNICAGYIEAVSTDFAHRDLVLDPLKALMLEILPEEFRQPPALLADLIPSKNALIILIVPIDLEAPKGRIILPQVRTIREGLDSDAMVVTCKESEYSYTLQQLRRDPDLVICDSQVVDKMVAKTPVGVDCTTFSILFARIKGDLKSLAAGARKIESLQDGDKILIAESCSHHAMEDDIGRIKIPQWIRDYSQKDITFEVCAGRDFPDNLEEYALVIQCGGCMNNRREMLSRLRIAKEHDMAITNYGIAIAVTQNCADRVLQIFPEL